MRVTYVAPHLSASSGWQSLTVGVVESMRRYGDVRPTVVVSAADMRIAEELLDGCTFLAVPRTQFLALAGAGDWMLALATWARVWLRFAPKPALVHSLEAYPTGLVGHWLARRLGRPHVITAAGTYSTIWSEAGFDRRLYTRVLGGADAIFPISRGTADMMRQKFPAELVEARLRIISPGTDYCRRVPRQEAIARTPSTPPLILSVGAIKPRKGYHVSLRAFSRVKQHIPGARYRIVGRIDHRAYFEELTRLVDELTLTDVEFLTGVSDAALDRHYREASLFLLTPEQQGLAFEGFGLVFLEAGAHGLPVVATRTGGVPDAVRHEETGLVATPGDVDQVAAYLLELLQHRENAARLGVANRLWAEQLTWERFAIEQRQVYDQILAAGRGSLS